MERRDNSDIKGYNSLEDLALDLSWGWSQFHSADRVWKQLDPEIWTRTRNPWVILQTVSREKLEKTLADPAFQTLLSDLKKTRQKEEENITWFKENYPKPPVNCIAYFSMEFMLSEALPIYSGGLGNVAGDQLKAASDLGAPVVGIGLLYQQGYFRQVIDKDGAQKAFYPFNDPDQLPITPVRMKNGELLRIELALPGWSLWLRAWEVKVGRVKLYLLDSNDASNYPPHRGITSELYGGDSEMRIQQELVLGIGGWRLLEALGISPDVCHLNEGHAAFVVLERAKAYMKKNNVPFSVALTATRAGNLFTTHTAVPAGFDRFCPFYIEQYLGKYTQENLKLSLQDLLALGRMNPEDPNEDFNMAFLAIRGSGRINGVSQLHARVSRHLFENLFPRWPIKEVPIGSVTNGVHMPSWSSAVSGKLIAEYSAKGCWVGNRECVDMGIRSIPDEKLWQMRNESRKDLIEYARRRLSRMLAARGLSPEETNFAQHIFDPNTLTIGFARRFATYKRPNLLLHDRDRLMRILKNSARPVQLIIAGKAHPADKPGQALIKEWIQFIRTPEVRPHIVALGDYDMHVNEHLVRGVDVWINTPRRPWEACGTSGMKVLPNGGINLSELDGWWVEAYNPKVGWALGDGKEHGDDPAWDAVEANALYDLLENVIAPEFYTRDKDGLPKAWIARVRESMAQLTARFSADRAVTEYFEKHYIPAATAYDQRAAENSTLAKQIVAWQGSLDQNWPSLRFGEMKVNTSNGEHSFDVQVYLNDLNPEFVRVQLYTEDTLHEMKRIKQLPGTSGLYEYQVAVPASRPANDFVPRIIPFHPAVNIPLESRHILWQR